MCKNCAEIHQKNLPKGRNFYISRRCRYIKSYRLPVCFCFFAQASKEKRINVLDSISLGVDVTVDTFVAQSIPRNSFQLKSSRSPQQLKESRDKDGCTPNVRVPMVFIVFSMDSLGL